mmetsp:Transcript_78433/g.209569  ORF Transcript_78433/g.209569 Transcript_78433/m.209569 type:complete len:236 (-) Transcript_78433:206-913(-)
MTLRHPTSAVLRYLGASEYRTWIHGKYTPPKPTKYSTSSQVGTRRRSSLVTHTPLQAKAASTSTVTIIMPGTGFLEDACGFFSSSAEACFACGLLDVTFASACSSTASHCAFSTHAGGASCCFANIRDLCRMIPQYTVQLRGLIKATRTPNNPSDSSSPQTMTKIPSKAMMTITTVRRLGVSPSTNQSDSAQKAGTVLITKNTLATVVISIAMLIPMDCPAKNTAAKASNLEIDL